MGSSRTPNYIVTIETPGYASTPMEWHTRTRYGAKGYGKPNAENLAKYMETFIASTQPGGCNAHLNANPAKPYVPVSAAIYVNNGMFAHPLATWEKAAS